jgi:hypothetical protein
MSLGLVDRALRRAMFSIPAFAGISLPLSPAPEARRIKARSEAQRNSGNRFKNE